MTDQTPKKLFRIERVFTNNPDKPECIQACGNDEASHEWTTDMDDCHALNFDAAVRILPKTDPTNPKVVYSMKEIPPRPQLTEDLANEVDTEIKTIIQHCQVLGINVVYNGNKFIAGTELTPNVKKHVRRMEESAYRLSDKLDDIERLDDCEGTK